jgi:hypothetical protein
MIDAIVTMFIYVDHLRRKRIAAAKGAGGACAVGG